MVKVGNVYRNDGNVNLKEVKKGIKLSMLMTYLIESSAFLNSGKMKILMMKEKQKQQKIKDYTDSFAYHLLKGKFKNISPIVTTFDSEDFEIVSLVLSSPLFLQYKVTFVELNQNLKELGAYVNYVVKLERLM